MPTKVNIMFPTKGIDQLIADMERAGFQIYAAAEGTITNGIAAQEGQPEYRLLVAGNLNLIQIRERYDDRDGSVWFSSTTNYDRLTNNDRNWTPTRLVRGAWG